MRSQHADQFNHDEDAAEYDQDVLNRDDPIRTGYADLLDWVAVEARAGLDVRMLGVLDVLELGSGTGNLTQRLLPCASLTCVDISVEMTEIARGKVADPTVSWVEADLLSFFDRERGPYDVIVSTYTVHHLTESEKPQLFRKLRSALRAGGRAVFGDLMFENAHQRAGLLGRWRGEGRDDLVDEIEGEFFWDLELAEAGLHRLGFETERQRFSDLSWGLVAGCD